MIRRPLRTAALATVSVLALSGCGTLGWPIITTADRCGQIELADGTTAFPEIILDGSGDVSLDVSRLRTTIEFDVTDLPDGYFKNPSAQDPYRVFAYGMPTIPVGWLFEIQQALDPAPGESPFQAGDSWNFAFQEDVPAPLTPNADGKFIYSSNLAIEEILPDGFLTEAIYNQGTLPLLYSFFHLPRTLITSCGDPILEEDFDEYLLDDSGQEVLTPNYRDPVLLTDSSSLEVFPGYVADLIDFRSEPTSVYFGSSIPGDQRIPILASVVPWFEAFESELGDVEALALGFDEMTEFERFWLAQLFFLEVYAGFEEIRLVQYVSFLNEGAISDDGPADLEPGPIQAELAKPLTSETYHELFLEQFLLDEAEYPTGERPITIEEVREEVGDLEYLFVYTVFLEELDNGDSRLSYSFDRYYPGVAGNLVTQEVFVQEQANLSFPSSFSGPVITSATPAVAQAGEVVEFSGSGLDTVTGITIDGKALELQSVHTSSIRAKLPQDLTPGMKNLVISSPAGTVTSQAAIRISASSTLGDSQPVVSVKKSTASTARVQIDSVVGAGKVQVMLNGKEVAWVRAGSVANPKLRGGKLIRTLQLVPGQKNAIEIFVDGERVRRVAYTG